MKAFVATSWGGIKISDHKDGHISHLLYKRDHLNAIEMNEKNPVICKEMRAWHNIIVLKINTNNNNA